jgi:predicted Zn-dependent protease
LGTFREAGFGREDALSVTGDITILREQIAVANTHGINDYDQSTILMATITAMIEGKDSKGTGWAAGTHFDQFDAEEAGRTAARSAIATISGQRIKSGRYNVVFGHQPVCTIFGNLIIPCLSLSTAILNISPFKEKLDELIMAEEISVYDDGSIPGQMASKRITCEGIPTGRTQLVERGRLVGLLADSYFANWAGDPRFVPRSGFRFSGGGRGHSVEPGISATNLVIESADPVPAEELLNRVRDGVFIGRLWYLYPIYGIGSGDFTGTVVGDSYLIKDGRIVDPLRPNVVRINDNWLRLMKDNILGVSRESRPTLIWAGEEIVLAPQIAVSDVELEEIDIFMDESLT